jgi:CheY-like chemotaxis protein
MHSVAAILNAMAGPKTPDGEIGKAGSDPSVSPQRLRILIVEDDTLIAWTLEAMLIELDHDVVSIAASGDRALVLAAEFEPDLIMMDINLGSGMSGIEAAKGIRRSHSARVVFVSAYGDPDTRKQVQEAVPGAPLLTKPVNLPALKRTLSHIRDSKH